MKKTYKMKINGEKYVIVDMEDKEVFAIDKKTLNVEGKLIYESFFENFCVGDSVELFLDESIEKSNDKFSKIVFNNIKEVLENISDSINKITKKED